VNGVHEMGGQHGMGPVQYERDEPVFHEPWEGRVYALTRAMGAWRRWTLDAGRYGIEVIPPAEYLRMTYYERWLYRLERAVVQFGFVTEDEARSGRAAPGSTRETPRFTLATADRWLNRGLASNLEPGVRPRFAIGDRVRARNMHPTGHTRLPRYARGKTGTIVIDHGVYVFPDTSAHEKGENRQHVYAVRFTARELWGDAASARDSVHLDLFDDYLDRG
jgi:nitrile hydratase subunit beta